MQQTIQITDKATEVIALIKKALINTPTGVSFCSIKNYTNEQGEVANHLFNIGASYENAKKKDIEFLNNLDVTTMEWQSAMVDIIKAKQELINSFENPRPTKDVFFHIEMNGKSIGVKVHYESGKIYVWGLRVSKTILKAVEYKEVQSSNLTIAKNELRKLLKTSKYRQFIFQLNGMSIKASGEELIFE
jgi:L-rhamnose mutarotase